MREYVREIIGKQNRLVPRLPPNLGMRLHHVGMATTDWL